MAALEYFQWIVTTLSPSLDQETRAFLLSQRGYLLTLRNEDERQRFVDELVRDIKMTSASTNRRHLG